MSTATVTPAPAEVVTGTPASTTPVTLTPNAIAKVKEIMASQDPVPRWPADWRGGRRLLGVSVLDEL